MAYKEEWWRVLEVASLVVGTGAVDLDGGNVKRLGVFVEVLRYIRRFIEVVI